MAMEIEADLEEHIEATTEAEVKIVDVGVAAAVGAAEDSRQPGHDYRMKYLRREREKEHASTADNWAILEENVEING